MIERECSFNVKEKKFTVKFPNVGQLIDLESLKQALTNNKYGVMAASGISSMYFVLDIVDAIAFYQTCVPNVAKYYDIKNYTTLSPEEIKDLVEAYQKEIKPWFDKSMLVLRGVTKEEPKEETKDGGDSTEEDEGSK